MIGQKKRGVLKDIIIRKRFTKVEIKKILIKSILQNNHVNRQIKSVFIQKYSKLKNFASISKQKNNICIMTGRHKGVLKHTNFSRHFVKVLGARGELQNFKIASW